MTRISLVLLSVLAFAVMPAAAQEQTPSQPTAAQPQTPATPVETAAPAPQPAPVTGQPSTPVQQSPASQPVAAPPQQPNVPAQQQARATVTTAFASGFVQVETVEEFDVYNEARDKLASVEHIRIGPNGQIMVELATGGFLGLGEQHVLIPVDRFIVRTDRLQLTGITEDQLKAMTPYKPSDNALGYSEMDDDAEVAVGVNPGPQIQASR